MAHRIRVALPGHEPVEVTCPDDLEKEIRGYQRPPLHLVAWGICEASGPALEENAHLERELRVLTDFAALCGMEGVQDLPAGTRQVGRDMWLVAHRVYVQLPDHPETA